MQPTLDVVAVGHAIVDVLAPVADDLVDSLGLTKGTMTLVDDERSSAIYESLGAVRASSGGSAANTCAGLASLGAKAAFIGKVRDDDLGRVFVEDIRAAGVEFDVPPASGATGDGADPVGTTAGAGTAYGTGTGAGTADGAGTGTGSGTGRCLVLVTPDAERTMCTCLGVGDHLAAHDIDPSTISAAKILYIEGYLCGLESTEATIAAALDAAGAAGVDVALSLSDPFWVVSHGDALAKVLERSALVFANEAEAIGMTGAPDAESAVRALAERVPTVVVTRGAGGCMVSAGAGVIAVPAEKVGKVVDTTGAGDLFAAGFLYGHVRGLDPQRCARLGGLSAGEVISHFGARPHESLAALAAGRGLI